MGIIFLVAVFPVVLVSGMLSMGLAAIGLVRVSRRARRENEQKPWLAFFITALGLSGAAILGVSFYPWDWGEPGSNATDMMTNTCMIAGLLVLSPGVSVCLASLITPQWRRRSAPMQ